MYDFEILDDYLVRFQISSFSSGLKLVVDVQNLLIAFNHLSYQDSRITKAQVKKLFKMYAELLDACDLASIGQACIKAEKAHLDFKKKIVPVFEEIWRKKYPEYDWR